jgi:hypothetical protein
MSIFDSDLESRVEDLEDKFEYPSLYLDNTSFGMFIGMLVRSELLGKTAEIGKMRSDLNLLAEILGYEWQEGGTWVKAKKGKKK